MSEVVSTIVSDETAQRLKSFARSIGKDNSETMAILLEESLRQNDFPYIEFRSCSLGRQAYLKNSSLAVAEVIRIAIDYAMDEQKTAEHFHRPLEWVQGAFLYAEAYPEEIKTAIKDAQAMNETTLKEILPQLEIIEI